jgi:N-glycosidase YbiA
MNTEAIREFQKDYRFLSNFWPATVQLGRKWTQDEPEWYNTVEHAYQAAKFKSSVHRSTIKKMARPGDAKLFARRSPRAYKREDFDLIKLELMEYLLRQKFTPDSDLAYRLVNTGEAELIEGNKWNDTFWGVDLKTNLGANHLGKMLMKIRGELNANT